MSNPVFESGIAALKFARQTTLGLLEDIPEGKLTHQPCVGANHALWIVGHLGCADLMFLTQVGNKSIEAPEGWAELFGMGSAPKADASAYPALAKLKEALADNRETLLAWFASMSTEELAKPLSDDFKSFASDHGMLMTSLAFHEGLHAGQLTVVRKSLGIAPMIG